MAYKTGRKTNKFALYFEHVAKHIKCIKIVKATNEYTVSCDETDKYYHKVYVENGTLKIKSVSTFGAHINVGWKKTPMVTIYLSKDMYDSLMVDADAGAVSIDDGLTFNSMDIDTSAGAVASKADVTGNIDISTDAGAVSLSGIANAKSINIDSATAGIEMNDVNCSNLAIESDTGAVELKNVTTRTLLIDVDEGAVALIRCDGTESIIISIDAGSLTATLLSKNKYFDVHCDIIDTAFFQKFRQSFRERTIGIQLDSVIS